MKKGIFNDWFRELATLIFTQTIQAFLLAIVMTIVINAMATSNTQGTDENGQTTSQTNYAAGLLAIIALSQFGKIELLVKNIFGVTSQYGDPSMQAGKDSLTAGKVLALGAAKKLSDNVKKVGSGVKNTWQGARDVRRLNKQRALAQSDLDALNDPDNPTTGSGDMKTDFGTKSLPGGSGYNKTSSGLGVSSGEISELISAIKAQTTQLKNQNNDNAKEKAKKNLDDIDAKIEEARKRKREGLKNIASGVAESAAAIPGAAVGATVGLGMGESVATSAVIGAGAADTIASGVVSAGHSLVEGHMDNVKARDKKRAIEKELRDRVTAQEEYMNKKGQMEKRATKDAERVYENYRKQKESQYSRGLNMAGQLLNKDSLKSSTRAQKSADRMLRKAQKSADKMKDAGNH